jgi:hypothetical protein
MRSSDAGEIEHHIDALELMFAEMADCVRQLQELIQSRQLQPGE